MVGDHDGVGAMIGGYPRVFGAHETLYADLARPDRLQPVDVLPSQGRIELLANVVHKGREVEISFVDALEVGEGKRTLGRHTPKPTRVTEEVDGVFDGKLRRYGEAIACIALPLPLDG